MSAFRDGNTVLYASAPSVAYQKIRVKGDELIIQLTAIRILTNKIIKWNLQSFGKISYRQKTSCSGFGDIK